jgi:hypothetical protein
MSQTNSQWFERRSKSIKRARAELNQRRLQARKSIDEAEAELVKIKAQKKQLEEQYWKNKENMDLEKQLSETSPAFELVETLEVAMSPNLRVAHEESPSQGFFVIAGSAPSQQYMSPFSSQNRCNSFKWRQDKLCFNYYDVQDLWESVEDQFFVFLTNVVIDYTIVPEHENIVCRWDKYKQGNIPKGAFWVDKVKHQKALLFNDDLLYRAHSHPCPPSKMDPTHQAKIPLVILVYKAALVSAVKQCDTTFPTDDESVLKYATTEHFAKVVFKMGEPLDWKPHTPRKEQ